MSTDSFDAQFRPRLEEFLTDLETFSTGSYLSEEEREFWDQPFDPKALSPLRAILEEFLNAAGALDPQAEDAGANFNSLVSKCVLDCLKLNARYADAVIEPEEQSDLNSLFWDMGTSLGLEHDDLESLSVFE